MNEGVVLVPVSLFTFSILPSKPAIHPLALSYALFSNYLIA